MSEKIYMDLVLAKHASSNKVYLFRAPAGTYLEKGERVIVETSRGEEAATVVGSCYYTTTTSSEYSLLVIATGATTPLKRVLSRFKEIVYKEEEETHGEV